MMPLPCVPPEVTSLAKQLWDEVDISTSGLPVVEDVRPAFMEWVYCGADGARMHDDRHLPYRYSVLLVCDDGGVNSWKLCQAQLNGSVKEERAVKGRLLLLDVYRAHALNRTDRPQDGQRWIACCWMTNTKREALSIMKKLKRYYDL